MKANRIRTVVNDGGVAVGMLLQEFGTRGVAKLLEYAGVDFVIIDMEHSSFGLERVADLIAWFKATEIAPIVRVPENLYHFLAGVLDAGALGVQVANVETADQARAIVRSVKYHPLGERGLGMVASHTDFASLKPDEYMPHANRETLVLAQIESALGLENVEEIMAVEGIDVAAVGHNDLTKSMGIYGQLEHPRFKEAMRKIGEAAKRNGKLVKVHPQTDQALDTFAEMGFQMMMIDSDVSIFRAGAKAKADHLRARSRAAVAR